jgi:hypothetical protein
VVNIDSVYHRFLFSASGNKVPESLIGLINTRDEVCFFLIVNFGLLSWCNVPVQISDILELDHVVDLCIPRGGNSLVQYIKQNTRYGITLRVRVLTTLAEQNPCPWPRRRHLSRLCRRGSLDSCSVC